MGLRELGFDEWFEARAAEFVQEDEERDFARISAVDRGSYLLRDDSGEEIPAELSGRLSYEVESSMELPCVGDWAAVRYYNDATEAIIHKVLPRKTFLRRKSAGENVDFQMIAANIDTAFIVQSCHFDFNLHRLDRYLVIAADGRVEPVVILTKTDLITQDELDRKITAIGAVTRARVLALSNITGIGFNEFKQMLSPGKTHCLLGSSGVGKTTLINRLTGQEAFETKAVSSSGEGVHTTSRRQLVVLGEGAILGAILIDTPGMRELGIIGASDGISIGFEEIIALSENCRYANCTHEHEPGCAVRTAVENGGLSEDRYSSYIKLKRESERHEMSRLDKRRKDKAFGRFIKSVKKGLNR